MTAPAALEVESPTRVLVVDDQSPFRVAARSLFESFGGFTVVGEAESGEAGVAMAAILRPRLVLMDVRLPDIDGMEATRRILADDEQIVVVLVSSHRRQDLPAGLDDCGAAAFFTKEDVDPQALEALLG